MLATPKHDGIFAHTEGNHLVSREYMPFPGFDEIIMQAERLRQIGGFTFLQGELYDWRQPFQDIQGIVRSGSIPEKFKAKIKLYVFNAGGQFQTTRHMFHQLREAALMAGCDRIEIVESRIISTKGVQSQLSCALDTAIDDGHEGLVLRHLDIEDDRRIGFVKLKPYKECDLLVVGINVSDKSDKSMIASITVQGKVDGLKICCKVPIPNKKIAEHIWDLSKQRKNLIVEIKHSGPNAWARHDDTYALRDATFIKTKEDRKELDNG